MDTITDAQRLAICKLYLQHVSPSWITIMTQRYTNVVTTEQLESRLKNVYVNFKNADYGFHYLRFSNIRVLLDPTLAARELTADTPLLCADSERGMVMLTYLEITQRAANTSRWLLEHILLETFKRVPGDDLFSICDDMKINLPYRYNPDNPEPKTITLIPARSSGKQHQRMMHRHVLVGISSRFEISALGSGQIRPKNTITIDCDVRLLDWFIDGVHKGCLDLGLIRKKQRKYAYKMLGETMVCTSQELGDKMAIHFGLVDINATPDQMPPRNYYSSDDSDSD